MVGSVKVEERVEIPPGLRTLEDFRRWALSDEFPERGRIDFISGRIEVDMSPEELFCHGSLKAEIVWAFQDLLKRDRCGYVFTDSTRVSCPAADLSVEPDVVFVRHETLDREDFRLIAKAASGEGRFVEIDGAPDLVVEIVSDSSVTKDTKRLPEAYFRAGVREFWLADARGQTLLFQIFRPGDRGYEPAPADADGYQPSAVLGRSFRLDRQRDKLGHWVFDLVVR